MTERPILFSGPLVRAVLADEKTQTRRMIKPQPPEYDPPIEVGMYARTIVDRYGEEQPGPEVFGAWGEEWGCVCPYGGPGDRLWVREAWAPVDRHGALLATIPERRAGRPLYRATDDVSAALATRLRWKPGIHMPRWASRLTLEIVSVRPERVQAISDADVCAEGVTPESVRALWEGATRKRREETGYMAPIFGSLVPTALWRIAWILINGRESWDRNDWLWAIEFRRLR